MLTFTAATSVGRDASRDQMLLLVMEESVREGRFMQMMFADDNCNSPNITWEAFP